MLDHVFHTNIIAYGMYGFLYILTYFNIHININFMKLIILEAVHMEVSWPG